jgi:hypothetical protein
MERRRRSRFLISISIEQERERENSTRRRGDGRGAAGGEREKMMTLLFVSYHSRHHNGDHAGGEIVGRDSGAVAPTMQGKYSNNTVGKARWTRLVARGACMPSRAGSSRRRRSP